MSQDDEIMVRTPAEHGGYLSDICLEIRGPDSREGIINYIRNFGDLYLARLNRTTWLRKYDECLQQLVANMLDLPSDPDILQDIDFKLALCEQARQTPQWRFPCVMEIRDQTLTWINGHSRLLAAGVSWADAWDKVDFVIFAPKGTDITAHDFHAVTLINDDHQLRTILCRDGDTMSVTIWADFYSYQDSVQFRINGVGQAADQTTSKGYLSVWQRWRGQHPGTSLPIQIFSDADSVSDSSGVWHITHMGPPPSNLIYHSNMSGRIYNEKKFGDQQPGAFTFYHFGKGKIDLAEILLWIDTDHSVFHSDDWSSIFVQPGEFKCRPMSLSQR